MPLLTRRATLKSLVALFAALGLPRIALPYRLGGPAREALAASPLVYISPLQSSGEESSCHGEVWFFVDKGDVVICSETKTWKATALRRGLNRARIWVGDYGPVWRSLGRYRNAPTYLAEAVLDDDPATHVRLMKAFAERYPDEWSGWESRFASQYKDGTRVLLRYRAIAD